MSGRLDDEIGQFLLSVFPDDVLFIWPNMTAGQGDNQPFISVAITKSAYRQAPHHILTGELILTLSQAVGTGTIFHQDMLEIIRHKICFSRTKTLLFTDQSIQSSSVSSGFFAFASACCLFSILVNFTMKVTHDFITS